MIKITTIILFSLLSLGASAQNWTITTNRFSEWRARAFTSKAPNVDPFTFTIRQAQQTPKTGTISITSPDGDGTTVKYDEVASFKPGDAGQPKGAPALNAPYTAYFTPQGVIMYCPSLKTVIWYYACDLTLIYSNK